LRFMNSTTTICSWCWHWLQRSDLWITSIWKILKDTVYYI
jgi:hypothetical protein